MTKNCTCTKEVVWYRPELGAKKQPIDDWTRNPDCPLHGCTCVQPITTSRAPRWKHDPNCPVHGAGKKDPHTLVAPKLAPYVDKIANAVGKTPEQILASQGTDDGNGICELCGVEKKLGEMHETPGLLVCSSCSKKKNISVNSQGTDREFEEKLRELDKVQDKMGEAVRYSGLVSFGTEPEYHYLKAEQGQLAEKLIGQLMEITMDTIDQREQQAREKLADEILEKAWTKNFPDTIKTPRQKSSYSTALSEFQSIVTAALAATKDKT